MIEENPDKVKEVIKKLKKLTHHKYIRITDCGNSAIFIALQIAKKVNSRPYLLIPDQGGWISFKRYPSFFNFKIKEIKTNYGLIDLEDLKEKVKDASAFIVTSFAGYFAEQPIKEISKICKKHKCLLIEDASGAVGDINLCKGKYSDIILGSFGKWKPINYGYGGFISTSDPKYFSYAKESFSMIKVHPEFYPGILSHLNTKRLNALLELSSKIKDELKDYDIIHKDKRGPNVVVKFNPGVVEYCKKNNYPYILCPNYIRVNEKAISIELKRLELNEIEKKKEDGKKKEKKKFKIF